MRFLVLVSLVALLALPAVGNACNGRPRSGAAGLAAERSSLAVAHPSSAAKPKPKPKKHAAKAKRYGYR
jgi:hypothetical protein